MHRTSTSIILSLTLTVLPTGAGSQTQSSASASTECSQPTEEQKAMIREAEKNHYTTRRVTFIGNQFTRDNVLRRRTNIGLQEGELFTRWNLVRSLRNVSTLKVIYPVKLKDVELHLDPSDKTVDINICFKEREKRSSKQTS